MLFADQGEAQVRALLQNWLADLKHGKRSRSPRLPEQKATSLQVSPPSRALLLVGSPRTRSSTSNSLGGYLFEKLTARALHTDTLYIHTIVRSKERMEALLHAVDAADLVVLAFPLYVDSLPAPVIEVLERIAVHRALQRKMGADQPHPQLFAALSNCGFPEPDHNATALAICADFAGRSGFAWAGSLALGGGEGLVQGMPLNEIDGRVIPVKMALDLAAGSLAQGAPIPTEAQALLSKPFIPAWLYRIAGSFGWRQRARKYRMQNELRRQPYL